jgi:hypothetical protein
MRQMPERVTLRFTPDQKAVILAAIAESDKAWAGISFHIREAVLHWARGMLSSRRTPRRRDSELLPRAHEGRGKGNSK